MIAKAHLLRFDPTKPIPDMQPLRDIKEEYRDWPRAELLSDERLVDPCDYGVRGHSFYSKTRDSDVDKEPIPGVDPRAFLRLTVVHMYLAANELFRDDPMLNEIFGGPVEVFIAEGIRARRLQQYLHDEIAPRRLRREHPNWSEEQIMAGRHSVFPAPRPGQPTPHMTGGGSDAKPMYLGTDREVDMGFIPGREYSPLALLDYHEGYRPVEGLPVSTVARDHRRAFFWTMLEVGFGANPTEFWHYNYGDQMWAWFMAEFFPLEFSVDLPPLAIYDEVDAGFNPPAPDAHD